MILALSDNTSRKHSLYRKKGRESCLRISRINLDSDVPHQGYNTGGALTEYERVQFLAPHSSHPKQTNKKIPLNAT